MDNTDRVLELENEIEELIYQLEHNESEQVELRSIARFLQKELEDKQTELEELEDIKD